MTATPGDLDGLRRATAPVLTWLRQDAVTSAALDRISALRATVTAEAPPSCAGVAGGSVTHAGPLGPRGPLDGTYVVDTTNGGDANLEEENYGHWVYVVDRGRFAFSQENGPACTWGYGTWKVHGATVEWLFTDGGGEAPNGAENKPGERFVFGWSKFRDTLTLTAVPGEISPLNFNAEPWHRTGKAGCPPSQHPVPAAVGGLSSVVILASWRGRKDPRPRGGDPSVDGGYEPARPSAPAGRSSFRESRRHRGHHAAGHAGDRADHGRRQVRQAPQDAADAGGARRAVRRGGLAGRRAHAPGLVPQRRRQPARRAAGRSQPPATTPRARSPATRRRSGGSGPSRPTPTTPPTRSGPTGRSRCSC